MYLFTKFVFRNVVDLKMVILCEELKSMLSIKTVAVGNPA